MYLVFFLSILGLLVSWGCGSSAEKAKMKAFIQDCQKSLDEYIDAIGKGDSDKKTKIEARIKDLRHQWKLLKMEISSEVTPQTMEKFDTEFGKLLKKFDDFSGKS
jgi:hypothetical protein